MKLRWRSIALAILTIGCIPADQALRVVSETALPGTQFNVELLAPPSYGGNYCYSIVYRAPSGKVDPCNSRNLGTSNIDETVAPHVQILSPGVFRITWGQGSQFAYAVVDVGNRMIVEDSNPSNSHNESIQSHYPRNLDSG